MTYSCGCGRILPSGPLHTPLSVCPRRRLAALPEALGQLGSLVELTLAENCLSAVPASTGSLRRLKDLDLRGNPLEGLPAGLLTDTPLQHLQLDERLLAKDGSLREDVEGREAYAARRKARIDKELHGKATGGDVNFSS